MDGGTLNIRHLRHVGLVVPDAQDAARFYEEVWGLRHVDDKDGASYLRGAGEEHHILALYPGTRKGLHHLSFALDDHRAVDAAAVYLRERGVSILDGPRQRDEPGGGYALRFQDPDGRLIELSAEQERLEPGEWAAAVVPNKVSHTVLNTPDITGVADFYSDILGFRVSDWSEDQMVFLRCNTDHHSVALMRAPHASLNHIAYELPTMEDVMKGIGNFRYHGKTQMWGPGRHGPGNNVFAYFQDAAGLVCEYTSDVEQILDEARWVPQVWQRKQPWSDRWNTAGPPPPEARAAMLGEADPGVVQTAVGMPVGGGALVGASAG